MCFLWNQSNKDNYSSLPNARHQISDFMIAIELHLCLICQNVIVPFGQMMMGSASGCGGGWGAPRPATIILLKWPTLGTHILDKAIAVLKSVPTKWNFYTYSGILVIIQKGMSFGFLPTWHTADLRINISKHKICRFPFSSSPILNDIPLQQLFGSSLRLQAKNRYKSRSTWKCLHQ